MRLKDKAAIVTGAGQGIGRAIAQNLGAEGARVAALDLDAETARTTADTIEGERGRGWACNVADSADVARIFSKVVADFGGLDIVVNNAGIGQAAGDGFDLFQERLGERMSQMQRGEEPTVFADHTIDMGDTGWQSVVDVNLNGAFYACREALRNMTRNGTAGSIVNISSTSAYSGEGGAHYCATKAAILGLTRSLAQEVGPRGIRVNAVVPGPTDTPAMAGIPQDWRDAMAQNLPLQRLAQPDEIARAAVYLATDDASFVTGQALCANGGMYML